MNTFLELFNRTLKLVGEHAVAYKIIEVDNFTYTVSFQDIHNTNKRVVIDLVQRGYTITVYESLTNDDNNLFKSYATLIDVVSDYEYEVVDYTARHLEALDYEAKKAVKAIQHDINELKQKEVKNGNYTDMLTLTSVLLEHYNPTKTITKKDIQKIIDKFFQE